MMSTSGEALASIKLEETQKKIESDHPYMNFISFIAQNCRHDLLMMASVCALSLFKIKRNSECLEVGPVEKIETGLLDFCLWNEIQQIFIGWRSSGIMEIFKANHQNGMLRFSKRMEWPQGILTMKWSPNQEVIALSTKTGMIFGEFNDWKWETFAHKFLDEQTKFIWAWGSTLLSSVAMKLGYQQRHVWF
ncbi:Protein CBG07835 [Caenorhabditis briggsae]|uniref:Protein CBG07835 n=1 Tax=Caenorhabditis briggsae TaxID=6238 RepID=A8X587_CAEBR|nr:Protein CBG07835 [Caenorhabditis briggsae]CAP27786.2 Protein CBG07835 [Caenorhabditis briggsae]